GEYQLRKIAEQPLPKNFFEPFTTLMHHYSSMTVPAHYYLAEKLLEGHQVTVEGFVYNHVIQFLGIVDSVMYPGTFCFARFNYPCELHKDIQEHMYDIAERCIQGIQLNNSFFNIEMIYNVEKNSIHIIEINPRLASQFAD